jgi:hypothetical protein
MDYSAIARATASARVPSDSWPPTFSKTRHFCGLLVIPDLGIVNSEFRSEVQYLPW